MTLQLLPLIPKQTTRGVDPIQVVKISYLPSRFNFLKLSDIFLTLSASSATAE